MPKDKSLTLSIIIPVYNEQAHLKACLDAIDRQTFAPDEVIIVDNNSTDGSMKIARQYSFVKIIREPKQGLIFARNAGFNAAKSDILARIDADAYIPPNWVDRVKHDFKHDSKLSGITGPGVNNFKTIYDIPALSKFSSLMYFWHMRGYLGINVLWGANMAIRRPVWLQVRKDVCLDDHLVHEDQDLSLLISSFGGKLKLDSNLCVNFDGAALQEFDVLREYFHRRTTTKRYHSKRGTFKAPGMKKVPIVKRFLYYLITEPLVGFFYLTSLLYTPRTKNYISSIKRQ